MYCVHDNAGLADAKETSLSVYTLRFRAVVLTFANADAKHRKVCIRKHVLKSSSSK